MLKIIAPGSYDFGGEPAVQLYKAGSRGLRGDDLRVFLKRAGREIVDAFRECQVAPGEVPVHLIAMGSTEKVNVNRNGDGFKCAMLEAYHSTFEKYAKFFRNHQNSPTSPSYGRVIKSAFNREMGRVELLVGLNATKGAADANSGFVADQELDRLGKGDDIPVSMSIRVPADFCSSCDNRARNRSEYCDGGTCKHGGLKHNIGRTFEDGHTLHADNRSGVFFDISNVERGADRTAFTLGRLDKAASAAIKSGAELAEEIGLTCPPLPGESPAASWAEKLAALERSNPLPHAWDYAFATAVAGPVPMPPEVRGDQRKLAQATRALADAGVILPVRDFLALALGDANKAAAAAAAVEACLPGIYSALEGGDMLERENPYIAGPESTGAYRAWAAKVAASHGLDRDRVSDRASRAVLRGAPRPAERAFAKAASATAANRLAAQYALYQLAALDAASARPEAEPDLLAALVARRNRLA